MPLTLRCLFPVPSTLRCLICLPRVAAVCSLSVQCQASAFNVQWVTCRPHMCALYGCILCFCFIRLPYMAAMYSVAAATSAQCNQVCSVLYVCLICLPCVSALYVCLACLPYMSAQCNQVCTACNNVCMCVCVCAVCVCAVCVCVCVVCVFVLCVFVLCVCVRARASVCESVLHHVSLINWTPMTPPYPNTSPDPIASP
jgi:hypothetical protein